MRSAEHGFRSQVAGDLEIDVRACRQAHAALHGAGAAYAHIAMSQAIADAGCRDDEVSNPRTGLIAGSGGPSTSAMFTAHQPCSTGATKRIGPFAVPKCMCSTISRPTFDRVPDQGHQLLDHLGLLDLAALHRQRREQIMMGKQDMMFAGGGEELDWTLSCLFDAMGAMSSKYNDTPERASRAFDADRDGFVIAGGGGMVVLEEPGACQGARREDLRRGDRLRRHLRRARHGGALGRGRRAGDAAGARRRCPRAARWLHQRPWHLDAGGRRRRGGGGAAGVRRGSTVPPISSTKSMTGHSQGAAGRAGGDLLPLMLEHDFIIPSINVESSTRRSTPGEIATALVENAGLDTVMTNSFGFGGTNGSMLLSKFTGEP
jgi:3-oxoacyl-[acyl-carrier-protein] synthase-1